MLRKIQHHILIYMFQYVYCNLSCCRPMFLVVLLSSVLRVRGEIIAFQFIFFINNVNCILDCESQSRVLPYVLNKCKLNDKNISTLENRQIHEVSSVQILLDIVVYLFGGDTLVYYSIFIWRRYSWIL